VKRSSPEEFLAMISQGGFVKVYKYMRIYLYSALRVMVFQVGDLRVGIFLATEGHRGTKRDKGTKGQRHR